MISQFLCYVLLFVYLKKCYKRIFFGFLLQFSYSYPIILMILSDYFDAKHSIQVTSLKLCFQVLLMTQCSALLFKHLSHSISLVFLIWLGYMIIAPSSTSSVVFIFIIVSIVAVYHKEIKLRVYSNLKSLGAKEQKKIEQLLMQMVPPHAYEHLKEESTVIDKFSQVTMLYADIVGFTA